MSSTARLQRCLCVAALLGLATVAATPALRAQETTPPSNVKREHEVKKGDTLWDLARTYLGNPFLWTVIYDANRSVVSNPHWIYPTEKLVIPGRDTTSTKPLGTPVVIEEPAAPPPPEPAVTPEPAPTVVGDLDLRRPFESLGEYRRMPWLTTTPDAGLVGRISRLADPTSAEDRLPSTLHTFDRVIIGDLRGEVHAGDTVQVVSIGRGIGTHGRIIEPLGMLRIDSLGDHTAEGSLFAHFGTARVGDWAMALPTPPTLPADTVVPVENGADVLLLQFLEDEPLHGTGDLAFLDLRATDANIGDEFAVYVPRRKIDNERPDILPEELLGVVRVVRVADHSATVRVIEVRSAGLRNGLPARLVRRTP